MLAPLRDLLLPAACLACGEPLSARARPPSGADLNLCPPCRRRLAPAPGGCAICGRELRLMAGRELRLSAGRELRLSAGRELRLSAGKELRLTAGSELTATAPPVPGVPAGYRCGECRHRPPPFERLLAAWSYRPPLDAVITAYKFRRLDYLGRHLAVAAAAARPELAGLADVVVPVPLHWRRRWRRGYDQAEGIARPLAAALGVGYVPALVRRRATRTQTGLGRAERRANPRGAFAAAGGRPVDVVGRLVRRVAPGPTRDVGRPGIAGRRVLLVDDVVTTGATLEAAAAALRAAGAAAVVAFAVARTPDDPDLHPEAAGRRRSGQDPAVDRPGSGNPAAGGSG